VSLPTPSGWLAELERAAWRPRLEGTVEADVAVVGGGLSGLWTALGVLARRPNWSVVVVEAERVGWGASGRNGGWVSALFPVPLARVAADHSIEAARVLRRRLVDNLAEIEGLLGADAAQVGFRREGSVVAARSAGQWRGLVAEVRTFRELGLVAPPELLDAAGVRAHLDIPGTIGGTFEEACASVQPARLVELLAGRVEAAGGLVLERSPVHPGASGMLLGVGGRVRAGQVVWATESYLTREPPWHRVLAPVASQIIQTAPLPEATLMRLGRPRVGLTFADARRLVVYGQLREDRRVVFGGRGAPYRFGSALEGTETVGPGRRRVLLETLEELLGARGELEVEASWAGTIGIARDWYPRVLHDPRQRTTILGGYAGDGVALSRVAGDLAASYATGAAVDPVLAVVLGRPWRSWEHEPLRWLGINVGLLLTRAGDRLEHRLLAGGIIDRAREALLGR
jgi:glycine/D-amino acid oxidase-like deaminating enzyme